MIAVVIADYIRQMGYSARAHHVLNSNMPIAPSLISAGMGEMCRMQLVLHPKFGARAKMAVITTNLPLAPDTPIDFGAQDFCRTCKQCARQCPAQAIPMDTEQIAFNGYLHWRIDVGRCANYRNRHGGVCGHCVEVCPQSNKPTNRFEYI